MENAAYALACVIVPVVWGLMVSFLLGRFGSRPAPPESSATDLDLHETTQ